MDSDFNFLPSEIARLVLGYLKENDYTMTYKYFLKECPHLQEYSLMLKQGRHFPLTIMGVSLVTMVQEYADLKLKATQDGQWSQPLAPLWRQFEAVAKALKQATKIKAKQIVGDLQNSRTRRAMIKLKSRASSQSKQAMQSLTDFSDISRRSVPTPTKCNASDSNTIGPARNSYMLRSKNSTCGKEKVQVDSVCGLSSGASTLSTADLMRDDGANTNNQLGEGGDGNAFSNSGDERNPTETYSDDGVQTEVMQKDISEPGVVLSPSASSQSKNLEIRDSGVEYLLSGNVYHSSPMSQRKENESPRSLAAQATSSPVNTSQIDTNQELPNSSVNFFSTSATCFSDLTAISVVPATPEKSRSLQHEQLALPWSPTLKSPRRKRHPPKKRKDAINTPISTHVPANNSRCETHVEDIHPTGNPNTSLAVPELFEKILNDTKLHEKLAETINERFLEMKSSHSTTNTQTSARRKASELAILSSVSEDTMDKILNKPLTMSEENIIDGIIQLTTSDPVFDTLFKTFDAVDNGIAHIPGDVPNTDTYCGNATTSTSAEYIEPAVSTLQTSAPSPCCLSADSKTSTVSSELQDTMSKKKPRRIKPTPCGPPVTGNSVDSSPSPWSALRPVASPAFAQAPEQQVIGSVLGTQTSTVIHSSVNGPASAGDSPSMNNVAVTCQDVVMYSHTNTVMTQHFEQSQFSDRALLSQISPERSVNSADNLAGQIGGASATCQAGCDGQQQSNEYTDVSITSDPSGQRSSGPFVQASPSVKTSASLALQAPMTSGPSVQRSPVSCVQVSAGPSSVQESASPCVQTSAVSGVGNVSPSVQNYYYSSDQLTGAGSGQNEIAMPASSYSGASGNSQFVSLASASQMNNNIVVSETVQTESGNVPNITTLYPSFSMEHSAVDGTSQYSPITSTTPTNGGIIVSGSTPQTNVPSETLLYETCGVDDGVCYQPVSTSSVVSYGPNTTLLSSPPTTAGSFLNQSVLPVVFSPSTNGVPSVSDSLQTVTCLPGSILSGSLGSESCDGENSETQIQKPAKKARPTARKTKSNPNPKRKCSKRSNKKGKRDMPVIVPATISSPLPQNINVSVQNNVTTAAADAENVSNMNVISVSTPQKTGDNTFDISQLITLSPGGQNWTLTENYNLTTEPMVVMTTTETPPKPNLTPLSNVQYVNSNLVSTQSPRGTQSVLLSSVIDVQTGSTYLKITSPARSPFKWPNILSKSGKKTSLHGQTSTEVNDGYFVNTKQPNVAPLSPHQETFIAVPICRKPGLVSKDHHVRSLSFDSMPITTISPSSLANPVTGAIMTYMSPKQKRSSNRSGTVCIRNLDCGGEAVTAADTPKPKVKGVKMVKTASSKIAPGQRIMELTLASPSGKKSTVMSLLDDGTPGGIRLPAKGKASPLKTVPEKKQLSVDSVPVKLPLPHLKRPPHKPHAIKPKPPATTVSKVKSRQKKKSSSSTKQTSTASHSASLKPSTSCSGRNLKRFTKLQGREKKSISNVSSDTVPAKRAESSFLRSLVAGIRSTCTSSQEVNTEIIGVQIALLPPST
ncbi:protein NPAT-like [Gigantopelta aegis]|uniref:protein NPAT-like n=1 Tax=Gigantopelta aegis TaxID=1735272 RepID=UPI001B88BE41|nr:protein NPAT-like [Gigantopelta aegis]